MLPLDLARNALTRIRDGKRGSELENQELEFKREKPTADETLKDLAEAAICFANSRGGVIVVGIDEKLTGAAAFVGSTQQPAEVTRRIYQLTRPPLTVSVEEHIDRGSRLVLVLVPESPEIHTDSRGRATHRVLSACEPMGASEHQRLREAKAGVDWSARTTPRQTDNVSPEATSLARRNLSTLADERRRLAKLSDADLLSALHVVADDRRYLVRAGELLFCRDAGQAPHPLIVYQYRQTLGGDPKDIQRLEGPLVNAVGRVLELVNARRTLTPIALPNGQQLEIYDFPEAAVREALINAVVHRDYGLQGPVVVDHSPQVIVITSPGPLVAGVTPENILTHPSAPRNRTLAAAMRTLGFAEEVGRGIDRIFREMIRSGRELPRFEVAPDHVRVSLVGGAPNTHVARFVASLPEDEREDTDTMLVLFRLCAQRTVDAERLAPFLQKSVDETESALRRLASERIQLLEPTRQTVRRAHPTYRFRSEPLKALGPAVAYQRRTVDETDRKILAHVREYGKITNKTVQNLFDVGIPRARDILRDLVDRGILVKEPGQERGPGVAYSKGPRFPASSGRGRKSSENLTLPFGHAKRRRRVK